MARRNKPQQSQHDRKVKQIADSLKRQGWKVQADLAGFDRPDPIGKRNHIPDILATRRGTERLIEVETTQSLKKDTKQHEAFRRSAGQKKKRSFKIEEA